MKEVWKYINGYDADYIVSNTGVIKSLKREKEITLSYSSNNWGYLGVVLHMNGVRNKHLVHRLVAEHFIANPDNKPEVNHIDSNKENNNANNLEWVTRSENAQHAYDNGVMSRGENHGRAKVSKNDVINIRDLYRSGRFTQKELGTTYGLTQAVISKIIRKDTWKHI